ncbi:hypothetical protein DACRYDRAFT_105668 [Dacryopinax primogenitus]|uniref:BTB domain-containing protein n=1 Tax=Dacryopinax primogenitus (strain DJM 731) TaxID=1858805 RepID=M5GBR7_DACPD|nr:uncharacterized protein DACRYDRAFT_105668 [Dacryopinax primogenitus]EJU03507.1 hypothetical protein DACRYDRAFT_105668 [Dacryopinax primogenitus]
MEPDPSVVYKPPASVDASPDIIIKSSNGQLLHAHNFFLGAVSTVFHGMFFSHANEHTTDGELPVVELAETSKILATLLSLIYPGPRTPRNHSIFLTYVLVSADETKLVVVYTPPASVNAAPDVAIKSSDGYILHAHKIFLGAYSTVFNDMFSLDEGHTPNGELPVVELAEASNILVALVSLFYPGPKTPPSSFRVVKGVLLAAEKYEVSCAADAYRHYLVSFLSSAPCEVYCICADLGLDQEKEAVMYQIYTLTEKQALSQEKQGIPAHRILEMISARGDRTSAIITELTNMLTWKQRCRTYGRPWCQTRRATPAWFDHWQDQIRLQIMDIPIIGGQFTLPTTHKDSCNEPNCACDSWDRDRFFVLKEHMEAKFPLKSPYL